MVAVGWGRGRNTGARAARAGASRRLEERKVGEREVVFSATMPDSLRVRVFAPVPSFS
jgi:hypothetical protein